MSFQWWWVMTPAKTQTCSDVLEGLGTLEWWLFTCCVVYLVWQQHNGHSLGLATHALFLQAWQYQIHHHQAFGKQIFLQGCRDM